MKPLSRYASLNDYVELAGSLGLEPARLIRDCGLDPAGFGTQDRWIPAEAVADLLERSAVESGREDFGLRLAQLRRFSNLGPLSLVIREEPDVRSALRLLSRHEHMYNEALHTEVIRGERHGHHSGERGRRSSGPGPAGRRARHRSAVPAASRIRRTDLAPDRRLLRLPRPA